MMGTCGPAWEIVRVPDTGQPVTIENVSPIALSGYAFGGEGVDILWCEPGHRVPWY